MLDFELIKQTLIALSVVSGVVWKLVEIFAPLFAKITDEKIRAMLKSIAAALLGWLAAWGLHIPALNAIAMNVPPVLDAILVGVLCAGGAAVFNVLFSILEILKGLLQAKRDAIR